MEDFLQECALTCYKSHVQSPSTHAPYFGTHIDTLRCACRKASDSQELRADSDNVWGAFKTSCTAPSSGATSENEHVSNGACTACPAGKVRPAGDDPSGGDTACAVYQCVSVDDFRQYSWAYYKGDSRPDTSDSPYDQSKITVNQYGELHMMQALLTVQTGKLSQTSVQEDA